MNTLERLRAGELAGVSRIALACGLREFPREIFALADSLEILDLSGNALRTLPDDLPRLRKLRVLFCSANEFSTMPKVLGQCEALEMIAFKANRIDDVPADALPPRLRWLILTDNRIRSLPPALGARPRLQKLMLAGNRLRSLPPEMAACEALELLRISANEFEQIPQWLLGLPRLSWLAIAGNPAAECAATGAAQAEQTQQAHKVQKAQQEPPMARIGWHELRLAHKLGEGASGQIHHAEWRDPEGGRRAVAVKLFKGAVTSDGWPLSEMAACIAAGRHPNLIPVLGRIDGHPEDMDGLVLELIDPAFVNLAGPPSLQSCTRDVYGEGARWSLPVALRMAAGIASAIAHLHAQRILHGDLYAHNILWNGRGDCLLGDFGAASFLPCDDAAQARSLQQTEARAFGCLLEELLQHSDSDADADADTDADTRAGADKA